MFSEIPGYLSDNGTCLVSFSKGKNGWDLIATCVEDLRLGLDHFVFCLKGDDDIRAMPLGLSKVTWSVKVEDIQEYIENQLGSIVDKEIVPALLAEMRGELEGSTGDVIPGMFRSIRKPNQLEHIFRGVDVAPDKSNKWVADFLRERPTKADGSVLTFEEYLNIRGNQELDQFNVVMKALSLRKTNQPMSIIIETPLNQYDDFNNSLNKPVANLANMIGGVSIEPILYKRFDFSVDHKQQLNINIQLNKIDDQETLSRVIGFSVAIMETLSYAAMLDIGNISLMFKSDKFNENNRKFFVKDSNSKLYDIRLNTKELTNVYNLDSLQNFKVRSNKDE